MNRLRILETNVLPASGVIYWLDGSTPGPLGELERLATPLIVSYTQRPVGLTTLDAPGRTAYWRRPSEPMIEGEATDGQKALVDPVTFQLVGSASDANGRYNPRTFAITAGGGAGHGLVLYPTPQGTRFGKAGGLTGTVRFAADGAPVPFALLQLDVDLLAGATLRLKAQTDGRGDFRIALTRLPPLPKSQPSYPARLRIRAPAAPDAGLPPNPDEADEFIDTALGALDSPAHGSTLALDLVPGQILPVRSFDRTFLSLQPT